MALRCTSRLWFTRRLAGGAVAFHHGIICHPAAALARGHDGGGIADAALHQKLSVLAHQEIRVALVLAVEPRAAQEQPIRFGMHRGFGLRERGDDVVIAVRHVLVAPENGGGPHRRMEAVAHRHELHFGERRGRVAAAVDVGAAVPTRGNPAARNFVVGVVHALGGESSRWDGEHRDGREGQKCLANHGNGSCRGTTLASESK